MHTIFNGLIQNKTDLRSIAQVDPVCQLPANIAYRALKSCKSVLGSGILAAQGVEHQVGRVATGEVFMTKGDRADWVAKTFAPALCEMEGGAIAQVCLRNGVKFTALKSVSDRLCQDNNAEEYFNYGEAMAKLNSIVLPFARALRDGE